MTSAVTLPKISLQALATNLAPFLGDITALKPQNTRFVATSWNTTQPPPIDYYFTDIQLAIDSVTDASPSNEYVVIVYPGMYVGASLLSQEKQVAMRKQILDARSTALRLTMQGINMTHKQYKKDPVFDFSEFIPDALTTITLKPNVSICGFAIPSPTVIAANLDFTPNSLVDVVSLTNLTFIDCDFTYTNLSPLTAGGNFAFNECAFFGGSINTMSLRPMDSISFIGGFIGFGVVNFGPSGVHNIDHSNILFLGDCNFTGDTGLGLYPQVRFHAPGTLIEDGVILTQGAHLILTGAFLQAYGAGIQMDTASFIYASFSHINAAAFTALNNSQIFLSNTPTSIFPVLDATSGCDRTICTAKLLNVAPAISQPITFASLGLPNYVTNSYQVILNFQLTPAQVGILVTPVFVQVDDGSASITGFNLSSNALVAAITFTFIQPNITMMDPN